MANILTVGKITPYERVCAMLMSAGHLLSSTVSVTEAKQILLTRDFDVVLLGERMTSGERDIVLEALYAQSSTAKVIYLYEFFIGNPKGADAIVDIMLGFDYLPEVVNYLTVRHGSIRPKSASKTHSLAALRALA
jgi:hypothetical protein